MAMSSNPLLRALREPLVQFAALGALVFALQRAVAPAAASERSVVVDAHKQRELRALFAQRQRRAPSAAESTALIARWIEDEVLFREALASELHRDAAIREQIAGRMRALVQSSITVPAPDEETLRQFYEAHRADYAQPLRVSLSAYVIRLDPQAEDRARRVLRALQTGQPVELAPTSYHERTHAQLSQLFGELADRIVALELNKWQQLRTPRGLYLVRVHAREPARRQTLAEARAQVLDDWREAQRGRRFREELTRLRSRYAVEIAQEAR